MKHIYGCLIFLLTALSSPGAWAYASGDLSLGYQHSCALRKDGTAACWGRNNYAGVLAAGGQATPPPGVFTQLTTGDDHTCGLRPNGKVECWGSNRRYGDWSGQASPPGDRFKAISGGFGYTCGIRRDGTVACWGLTAGTPPSGVFEQLSASAGSSATCGLRPDGSAACWSSSTPLAVPAGVFERISTGWRHACGLRRNGSVECWNFSRDTAITEIHVGPYAQVSSGGNYTCALESDGSIECWGDPSTTGYGDAGQAIPPSGQFQKVVAGFYHTCGVRRDGTLECWGANGNGQSTVTGAVAAAARPACVIGEDRELDCNWEDDPAGEFVEVSSDYEQSCGVRPNGTLECWWTTADPPVSSPLPGGQLPPTTPTGIFRHVSVGSGMACAIDVDGALICFDNDLSSEHPLPPAGVFTAVALGGWQSGCALRDDGALQCWGPDYDPEVLASDPGLAPPEGRFRRISASREGDHRCAIRSDGTLACWGPSVALRNVPSGTFTDLVSGVGFACALAADSSVVCWSDPDWLTISSPPGQFAQLSAFALYACGVRLDGSVACWGEAFAGETSPPAGRFTSLRTGFGRACGTRRDGTIECWGRHAQPEGPFVSVAGGEGDGHLCAVRAHGAVVCWGQNDHGQASPPPGRFEQIGIGWDYSCGLRTNRTLACWGNAAGGRTSPPRGRFTHLASLELQSCALRSDGGLACWGPATNELEPTWYSGGTLGIIEAPEGEFTSLELQSFDGYPILVATAASGAEWWWGYFARQPLELDSSCRGGH